LNGYLEDARYTLLFDGCLRRFLKRRESGLSQAQIGKRK
jgi:hypothetical protein